MQRLRAFGQQVEDVAVVALDLRRRSRIGVQFGVDGGEEFGQTASAGAGGQNALLIVAELSEHELEFMVGLELVHFAQQLRLGAARSSSIALCSCRSDMFEVQFCCENPAGPVGHLQRNRPPEHTQCHWFVGDRGESEAGSGRGIHPGAEPEVADSEAEPGQQQSAVAGVIVERLDELDRLVDGFDDDPFVVGAAEALALDDLADDAVALQTGDRFLDPTAADPQFHQLTGPHSGRSSQDHDRRGAGDADQSGRFGSMQWQCPRQQGCAVGGWGLGGVAAEDLLDPDGAEGVDQRFAQCGHPFRPELDVAGLPSQDPGGDRQQRVARVPAGGESAVDVMLFEHRQRCAGCLVVGQQPLDVADHRRGAVTKPSGAGGPDVVDFADLLVQLDDVRAEGLDQVQGRGEHRLQHFGADGRCLVSLTAGRHFSNRGCCRTAPGAQIGRNPVGGEQVTVVDQIDDHLRGSAADTGALLAHDDAVGVDDVAPERQVLLAEMGVEFGEGSNAPLIEPAEEFPAS